MVPCYMAWGVPALPFPLGGVDTACNAWQADLVRDSDLDAAISQSLDEAAASPQKVFCLV